MNLSRTVTLKLLKRQEWGGRALPLLLRRRRTPNLARRRRSAGLSRP
jgi:hypothetical protein